MGSRISVIGSSNPLATIMRQVIPRSLARVVLRTEVWNVGDELNSVELRGFEPLCRDAETGLLRAQPTV